MAGIIFCNLVYGCIDPHQEFVVEDYIFMGLLIVLNTSVRYPVARIYQPCRPLSLFRYQRLMMRLTLWISLLASQYAVGHGGVAFEEDLCVIRIDFLTAHFTAYQPETSGSEEFCEDVPDAEATLWLFPGRNPSRIDGSKTQPKM